MIEKASPPQTPADSKTWHVYVVRCSDGSLYTGVALSPEQRCVEHNTDNQKGARYTRSRRPVNLVYCQPCDTKQLAYQREYAIKRLPKQKKELLIRAGEFVEDIRPA